MAENETPPEDLPIDGADIPDDGNLHENQEPTPAPGA